MHNLYSARQVATTLGISVQHVRRIAGRFGAGRMVDGRLVFTDADIDRLRQRRQDRGPTPRKQKAAPSEE